MNYINVIKLHLAVFFLLFGMGVSAQAQQPKKNIQILPTIGMPIQFFSKDIYSAKPLNFCQQFGVELQKNISNKITFGIEAQYIQYNLKQNVVQTYQRFITPNSVQSFSPTTVFNGIVNIGYAKKGGGSKKGGETGIIIGLGIERLTTSGNNLQIPNPFNGNQLTSVYRETEGRYSNPLLQLSLTQTFYLKPCLGITAGIKVQYIRNNQSTIYKAVPSDTNTQSALDRLFLSPDIINKASWHVNVIPSIGIRYVFGGCRYPKRPEDPPKPATCFGLQWKNSVPRDSCFRGDTLKFNIININSSLTAMAYEIYIAPVNDLNNQRLLYSLPYPSSSFYISTILLDADKEYTVIVKLKNRKKEDECLQFITPVKRCADCCKDVKLPK